MKKYQWVFRIFLYLSVLFLVYYLIKFDYLSLNSVNLNYYRLIPAVVLLWLGFFLSTISWKYALKFHGYTINNRLAVVSHGLSVFAKYVPGKVWVILGRAAYVGNQKSLKISELSFVSLKEQLLYILLGLIIAFVPALLYFNHNYWVLIILVTISGLCLVLFIKPLHDFGERLVNRIFKREVNLPFLSFKLSVKLSFYIILYWAFFSVGFYFLVASLTDKALLVHIFAFPLAVSYGVLALFTPGGIGVREGLLVAFLTATGVNLDTAVTISVISRLWFISGEIFLFTLAALLKKPAKG
jgi:uncharacterized membrane protein YbhN (UPF0104 family)